MEYSHTQVGRLDYVLFLGAAAFGLFAWLVVEGPDAALVRGAIVPVMVILVLCGLAFRHLTVQDEGLRLALRFGPLPLFRKHIAYADITEAEPGRTNLLDGWGIHYVPGRGWTYNVWGFDCVVIRLGRKTIRVGTDDPAGLTAFLRRKIGQADGCGAGFQPAA